MKPVCDSRGATSPASCGVVDLQFLLPFLLFCRENIPHGLVEHKARPILDPALYSERKIEHGMARLCSAASGPCLPASLERLLRQRAMHLTKCSARLRSVCLCPWTGAGGIHGAGGSWCRYILLRGLLLSGLRLVGVGWGFVY
jgi:hypothetical protein